MKKIYEYEMTLAEWIGLAVILATPYLTVGVIYTISHRESMGQFASFEFATSFVQSTLTWPWLMFSSVLCLS